MTLDNTKGWALRIFLGYILIGSIYYISGVVVNLVIGKQIIFSPVIGYPLTIIGWPWMVYGDLIHHQTLGVRIPTVLALLSLGVLITLLILKIIKSQGLRN